MKKYIAITINALVLFLILTSMYSLAQLKQKGERNISNIQVPIPVYKQQGYTIKLWMNNSGVMGYYYTHFDAPNLEYPVGSSVEHLWAAGPMIGAVVYDSFDISSPHYARVTEIYNASDGRNEMRSNKDIFWQTSMDTPNSYNHRLYDDDGDGKIDEDELDGVDNDGDGKIDEDYGAISENDLYCVYTDTFHYPPLIMGHNPMGIKVWQRSFTWYSRMKEPILPFEYTVVNVGRKFLRDVYIGFCLDFDVGPISVKEYYQHNYAAYIDSIRTVYIHNPIDRGSTPIGLTLLGTSRPINSLNFVFHWKDYSTRPDPGTNDSLLYCLLNGFYFGEPVIAPNQPITNLSDTRIYFSFGPYRILKPGDSLKFSVALVSGNNISEDPNSMASNAVKAINMYDHAYENLTISSPPLRLTRDGSNIKLDWERKPNDPGPDPLENWDENNSQLNALPDTHWRRRNPPVGLTRGGRNFEGFRVWRSESDTFNLQSFALLAEYDINDDLGYGNQTGLYFTFTDTLYQLYKRYWYSVTSYSIPEVVIVPYKDSDGKIQHKTFYTSGWESNIRYNATRIQLFFEPSKHIGEVKVIPNPYRGDVSYTDGLGFEGSSYNWSPEKRAIWFINLPEEATIRIYTLTGEVITTIHHDDADRSSHGKTIGQEEWALFSESGREIASGLYVFSVDSEFEKQIGKFVIIK